jgi:hypothetical protein
MWALEIAVLDERDGGGGWTQDVIAFADGDDELRCVHDDLSVRAIQQARIVRAASILDPLE